MRPFLDRKCANSVNLSVCTLIWLDKSVKLCHSPSLRIVKNFSIVMLLLCSIPLLVYLTLAEPGTWVYPECNLYFSILFF